MKIFSSLILVLLPLFVICQTVQTNDSFSEFLINGKYLSKEEVKEIRNDSLFTSIYDICLKRYNMDRRDRMLFRLVSPESLKITKALIEGVYSYHKVNMETYDDLLRRFNNNGKNGTLTSEVITDELDVFQYLYENEMAGQAMNELHKYHEELLRYKVINKHTLKEDKVPSNRDLLELISKKIILNTDSLPESIEASYKIAFERIAQLDPSLAISDFKFSIENVESENLKYESAVVKFTLNEKEYITHNSYNRDYKSSGIYTKLDKNYFRIFNKILTDQNSEYRVMDVERVEQPLLCLVLINKEQYNFLREKDRNVNYTFLDPYWFKIEVSKYWNPFNLLSQHETEKLFNQYDSIGLFAYMTNVQKQKELLRLKSEYLLADESLLYNIDNICLGFDWEMFDGNQPYKKAILEFASITRGEFNPMNIKDNFSFKKKNADISFEFNDKVYKARVKVDGDWYSGEFLDLIILAIAEGKLSGKFYELPDGGQVSGHIYLTQEQYKYLLAHASLRFGEEN